MNLKTLLSVYAVLMAIPGAVALVVPSALFTRLYGVPPLDGLEISLLRSWCAMAIGLGVMCWTARTAEASKARDAMILGLTVLNGLWAVVFALTAMASVGNWVVWADAALLALVTVLFIITGRQGMSGAGAGGATPPGM